MKESHIYLIAGIITILVLVVLSFVFPKTSSNDQLEGEEAALEEYMIEMVESSKVVVYDKTYHGVYEKEEILEVPDGFESIGEIVETEDGKLNGHLTSNALTHGIEIYYNANDTSKVYAKIPATPDDPASYDSYLLYALEE